MRSEEEAPAKGGRPSVGLLIRPAVIVFIFLTLSLWHQEIVAEAARRGVDSYQWVRSATRLLPSPTLDLIGVPINWFFVFGLWPAAVAGSVASYSLRVRKGDYLVDPIITAVAYMFLHGYDYGNSWDAFLRDFASASIMLALVMVPFSMIGEKFRRQSVSGNGTNKEP